MLTLRSRSLQSPPPECREAILGRLPSIERLARRLRRRLPCHLPLEDMVSVGLIGLMEPVERFDPRRSPSSDAHVEFRIKAAILDALQAADPLSRDHVPR